MAQQLALELSLDLGLVLKTDSAAARQATEKIGALCQKHMQLRWHFLKDLVHNGLIVIEKVPTLMNISDMLTKAVTRQILRRCLAQAESWRIDGERVDEEYVVEINMVETGLARRDRPQPVENDRWSYKIVLTLILVSAGVVIYLYLWMSHDIKMMWKKICPTTRTLGTQSQATYTAVAHHAAPRLTVLPDLRQGVFVDGRRISSDVILTPRCL